MTEPQLPIEYGDSGLVARNKINNSWTKLLEDVEAFRPSIGENGNWYIGTTDTGIHAEGYTTSFRVDSGYIQYKEENSNVWNNLIAVADLKGDTGNGIESVTATKSGKITTVTITFTEDETPYTFQISDGADGQDGEDGQDGQDGTDGVGIAGITTNKVGKITTVTVSYTDGSTPDSFEISDGADGQDGQDGTDGTDGTDGNGIDSVTSSKSGKVTTVTMTFTDGTTPPFSFTVTDGEDGQGSGDVLGPSASVDGDIVTFDGVSGKLIKDSGKKLSDLVDIASAQTITGAKTYATEPILPTKSTLPVSPSSTSPATEGQVESVKNAIPSVVDNVTSTSTTSALSANQGTVLKGLIDNLNARGKFLSLWNCATGLPISFPEDTPYTFGTGDYFMVETVDTSDPVTNYRPNGSSYSGTASSTEETNEVAVGDFYVYDGSVWLLATNHGKTVSFANLAGQPSDNLALNAELNVKRFALSSYSDTITGQAIYDYLVTAGKYPIVVYNNESYIFSGYVNSDVVFRKVGLTCSNYSNQAHQISISGFKLNVTSGTVTEIMGYSNSTANPYLATNVNYSSPYTPAYEGSPATKKYVDDNVAYVGSSAPANPTEGRLWYDTTNDVLKSYDGSNWNEVGGGGFTPENVGNTGDKLEKTNTGYQWVDGELVEIKSDDYSAMRGPCDDGFHVPTGNEWNNVITIMSGLNLPTTSNWVEKLHLPNLGYRANDGDLYTGESYYWACTSLSTSSSTSTTGQSLHLPNGNNVKINNAGTCYGNPIRAFKNNFVIPTASWTVIQGTLGSAGIFRNQTDGLISITSDGTTGYTIQDKNLGATTVYNNGDTLSESNCGKLYQWGNCYGFSYSGTITTSSTKVDASTYGPGNYYSSSTFITSSTTPFKWDTSNNFNLRGGETGVILGGKFVGEERINEVPTDGTVGQVLTKQSNGGYGFEDISSGGLPLEYVGKVTITTKYGITWASEQYNYPTFIIAVGNNVNVEICVYNNGNFDGHYYTAPYLTDSRFVPASTKWGINSYQALPVTCYVYRMTFPS